MDTPGGYELMMIRMRRGQARAYAPETDGAPVGCWFTQDWSLFQRSMGLRGESRLVLGPGWTDPPYRARGIFGWMMNHAISAEAQRGYPRPYGVAPVTNTPSRNGVKCSEAICPGCHEAPDGLWVLSNAPKALTHLPARIDTLKDKPA